MIIPVLSFLTKIRLVYLKWCGRSHDERGCDGPTWFSWDALTVWLVYSSHGDLIFRTLTESNYIHAYMLVIIYAKYNIYIYIYISIIIHICTYIYKYTIFIWKCYMYGRDIWFQKYCKVPSGVSFPIPNNCCHVPPPKRKIVGRGEMMGHDWTRTLWSQPTPLGPNPLPTPLPFDHFLMYPLVMTNSLPWYRWPIEIDALPGFTY